MNISAIVLAALTASGAPEASLSEQDLKDITCLSMIAIAVNTPSLAADDKATRGLHVGFGYWMGRVETRHPGVNWSPVFARRLTELSVAERAAERGRCGNELVEIAHRAGAHMEVTRGRITETRPQ